MATRQLERGGNLGTGGGAAEDGGGEGGARTSIITDGKGGRNAPAHLQAAERRWTATEKEVHARMRAFARYMEPGAHGALADGLVLEQRLRGRIHVRRAHRFHRVHRVRIHVKRVHRVHNSGLSWCCRSV